LATPASASSSAAQSARRQETLAEKRVREERLFGDFGTPRTLSVPFQSGKLLGGNSGVRLHEVDGRKVAIKPGHGARAVKTELLAQALFRAVGAPTLRATPVLIADQGSVIHLMSDFLEGTVPDKAVHAQFGGHPDVARFAATDMLLSNWDSHKNDAYIAIDGRVVRIDVGGSLDLRAQGGIREGWTTADIASSDFDVEEIKPGSRMRTTSDGPFRHLTDAQVADSVRRVAARLTPETIDAAIAESGYPGDEAAALKEVLQKRRDKALEWADQVYPALELQNRTFGRRLDKAAGTGPRSLRLPERDGDSPTALHQLIEDFGYRPSITDFDDSRVLEHLRSPTPGPTVTKDGDADILSFHEAPVIDALGPPAYTFSQTVDAIVPEVGPEELLRSSQHGDDHARQRFAEHSAMLDDGVLIRRMSEAEVNAFRTALASEDLIAIQTALFGVDESDATTDPRSAPRPTPAPKRGDIVWSLNEPFTFTRELKSSTAAADSATTHHDDDNYKKVLEIPVTAKMAEHLRQRLYISNPAQGAKPAAFQGNPNLKYEGTAGGANDSTGVPNVVIKRNGFAEFWSTVHTVRVFDATTHVSANRYEPAVETKEERQARQMADPDVLDKQRARRAAKSPAALEDDDDFGLSGMMLGDEPAPQTHPTPVDPVEHDRVAPTEAGLMTSTMETSTEETAVGLPVARHTDAAG
jgi:hypothetical protein